MKIISLSFMLLIAWSGCSKDDPPTQSGTPQQPTSPTSGVIRVGTFSSQNGYATEGMVEILRDSVSGDDAVRTRMDFRVSGGAGSIGIWMTDAAGAANLNSSPLKIRVGVITSGFQGVYSYAIPGGLGSYTHVVTFCEAARINFGNASLGIP